MLKRFAFGTSIILVLFVLGGWAAAKIASFQEEQNSGLIASGILATANIVVAFGIIQFSIQKDQKTFSKIFLTGMGVRLVLMLTVILAIIRFTRIDSFVFISALFILYFLFQIWEVVVLNSYLKGR